METQIEHHIIGVSKSLLCHIIGLIILSILEQNILFILTGFCHVEFDELMCFDLF